MPGIDASDKLELLLEDETYKYYIFHPRYSRLFPKSGNMRKMNLLQTLRFALMKRKSCRIYIIADASENVLGSIAFSTGNSYRFPFANKNDLIYGPSYTLPEYRGKGLAVRLFEKIFNNFEKEYNCIYATVKNDNLSSIKCLKKSGFDCVAKLQANKFTKSFDVSNNGDHTLMKIER